MEQVNNCVIKNTIELSMLGNCFPDWGEGFFGVGGTGSECLCKKKKFKKKEKKEIRY